MAGWPFCDCCTPDDCDANFKDAAGGGSLCNPGFFNCSSVGISYHPPEAVPTHPCAPFNCVVGLFKMCFPTAEIAEAFVGAGNYDALTLIAGDWVLFFTPGGTPGAGTFARDGARTPSLEIDVEAMTYVSTLGFSTRLFLVPVEVRLGGTWTWNRRSNDPNDADFHQWDLTDGTPPESASGECLGMALHYYKAGLVFADDFGPKLCAEFEVGEDGGECCEAANVIPCLTGGALLGGIVADGWNIGGEWSVSVVPCCTDGAHVVAVIFSVDDDFSASASCRVVTVENSVNCPHAICNETKIWGLDCADRDDVKSLPAPADFYVVSSTAICDPHNFTALNTSACDDSDPGPPEDCPENYCKYKWCGADWQLVEGVGCDDPCPTYDGDPPAACASIYHYVCCGGGGGDTTKCDTGKTECLGNTCTWTWSSLIADWSSSECTSIECTCQGKPSRAGAFNGESVDGICCKDP